MQEREESHHLPRAFGGTQAAIDYVLRGNKTISPETIGVIHTELRRRAAEAPTTLQDDLSSSFLIATWQEAYEEASKRRPRSANDFHEAAEVLGSLVIPEASLDEIELIRNALARREEELRVKEEYEAEHPPLFRRVIYTATDIVNHTMIAIRRAKRVPKHNDLS